MQSNPTGINVTDEQLATVKSSLRSAKNGSYFDQTPEATQ